MSTEPSPGSLAARRREMFEQLARREPRQQIPPPKLKHVPREHVFGKDPAAVPKASQAVAKDEAASLKPSNTPAPAEQSAPSKPVSDGVWPVLHKHLQPNASEEPVAITKSDADVAPEEAENPLKSKPESGASSAGRLKDRLKLFQPKEAVEEAPAAPPPEKPESLVRGRAAMFEPKVKEPVKTVTPAKKSEGIKNIAAMFERQRNNAERSSSVTSVTSTSSTHSSRSGGKLAVFPPTPDAPALPFVKVVPQVSPKLAKFPPQQPAEQVLVSHVPAPKTPPQELSPKTPLQQPVLKTSLPEVVSKTPLQEPAPHSLVQEPAPLLNTANEVAPMSLLPEPVYLAEPVSPGVSVAAEVAASFEALPPKGEASEPASPSRSGSLPDSSTASLPEVVEAA